MQPKWWETVLAWWNELPPWATAMMICFGGAIYNYVDAMPSENLLSDLATWQGAWLLTKGALGAGLAGVLLWAKQSFLKNVPTLTELRLRRAAARMAERGVASVETLSAVLVAALLGLALVTGAGAFEASCTPAQQAVGIDITTVVLRGLVNGESLPAIEADVVAALRMLDASMVDIDVAAAVEDAIQLILDLHLLPDNLVPEARMRMHEAHASRKGVAP